MVKGRWSWIVPPGLWELAKPLLPPSGVRPQVGGTQNIADEAVFAAIVYVLVSGCAWRALPPCFGAARSTVHRRFTIWARAGMFARPHREILDRMRESGLLDLSRVLLDSAHIRVKKAPRSGVRVVFSDSRGARRCWV
ncbi:transposase [Actinokineospora sp. G85]|uniref:transposase n=1 Tax=Actinokineospora sp. G85 TaxID=3406626 RepID=UPI003C77195E